MDTIVSVPARWLGAALLTFLSGFSGAANAQVTFDFRATMLSCNVGTPNSSQVPCPIGEALPESLALFPISVSITFTEASVAIGQATLDDIVDFSASAGDVLSWDINDFDDFNSTGTNFRAGFTPAGDRITSFAFDVPGEPGGDFWCFGTRLPNGATLDIMCARHSGVGVLNDVIDPGSGRIVRIASAHAAGFFSSIPPLMVEVDVKPGNTRNRVLVDSTGQMRVAILGSADFDALQVDPASARLGPALAPAGPRPEVADYNGDGYMDLGVRFRVQLVGLTLEDTEVTLLAQTYDGVAVEGTDAVKMILHRR